MTGRVLALLIAALFLPAGEVFAAGQRPSRLVYHLKPSEVVPPSGVSLGAYRRVIHPFENWTLICDENLQNLEKVCNISQTTVDGAGEVLFSWSLAATESGDPLMILRAPPTMSGNRVTVVIDTAPDGIPVTMECDQTVCVGLLKTDAGVRQAIGEGQMATVSYTTRAGGVVSLSLPLQGLASALAAIGG